MIVSTVCGEEMAKLIIKAANGQVDDFRVEAPPAWTILELKRFLFRHYPSKPVSITWKLSIIFLIHLSEQVTT